MSNYLSDRPTVYLNGIDSGTYQICLAERPTIPSPQRLQSVSDSQFSQRGSFRANTGWGDIAIKLKFNYLEEVDGGGISFRMAFSRIRSILFSTTRLEFNDDYNAYYVVKHVEIDDAENDIIEYGEFDVTFTCSPFGYLNDDDDFISHQFVREDNVQTNTKTRLLFENDGLYECFPTIRIKYVGAITSKDPAELTLSPSTDNPIRDTAYNWQFKAKIWKPYYDLIIDSENTLVYWSDTRSESFLDASKDITMKTFPIMGLGEYVLNSPNQAGKFYQYTVEVERNRVI